MSVRKRTWTTRKGESKEAWIVDYSVNGSRHIETFERKKDADAREAQVTVNVGKGIHIAPNKTPTVAEAGKLWIEACEAAELQRASVDAYEQHLRLHIVPSLGAYRLAQLTTPLIREFADNLRAGKMPDGGKRSQAMTKRVLVSLGTMLADAQERGLVATNVVRGLKSGRKRGKDQRAERRGKLKAGVDIPTPEEIKAIIAHLPDRYRPLLLTAMFTGLRASELRGLRWTDVDLKQSKLHVSQRADKYLDIGKPKSEAGERTVPLPPMVVNMLREWKLRCPKSEHGLAFPTGAGEIEHHANILHRGFEPAQIVAGITVPVLDAKGKPVRNDDGKPVVAAKYALHALRHFYASWCINRRADGGLELPIKMVQERMGHSTINLTADVYGHLFPSKDDGTELQEAEKFFLA
jgi:integrase